MTGHGFAIVGCGVISRTHARAIAALPEAHLVTAVDVEPERAAALTAQFGGEPETDLGRALSRPDVDVVSVCVPSGLHAEVGCQAAAAGKHVLVEKPIDITLGAADRLIAAAEGAGVKLAVISQHRFDAGVRQMKDIIASGRLGPAAGGDAYIEWYRTQDYYDSGDWRGTWALDGGGCLMNQGVHYVDLLRWMMGPVGHRRPVPDGSPPDRGGGHRDGTSRVRERRGRRAGGEHLDLSGNGGAAGDQRDRGDAGGRSGVMRISELKDYRGETSFYGRKVDAHEPVAAEGAADPASISDNSHQAQIQDLLEAIDGDRDPFVTGREGRHALEVVLGVYDSAQRGAEVQLTPVSELAHQ